MSETEVIDPYELEAFENTQKFKQFQLKYNEKTLKNYPLGNLRPYSEALDQYFGKGTFDKLFKEQDKIGIY